MINGVTPPSQFDVVNVFTEADGKKITMIKKYEKMDFESFKLETLQDAHRLTNIFINTEAESTITVKIDFYESLKAKILSKIELIAKDTKGIRGFFRFLFNT